MYANLHLFAYIYKRDFDHWTKSKVFTGGILDITIKNSVNQKIMSKAAKKSICAVFMNLNCYINQYCNDI